METGILIDAVKTQASSMYAVGSVPTVEINPGLLSCYQLSFLSIFMHICNLSYLIPVVRHCSQCNNKMSLFEYNP